MNRLCHAAGLEVVHLSGMQDIRTPQSGAQHLLSGAAGRRAVEAGVATQAEVDELSETVRTAWDSDPNAYVALDVYQVIARKPES